LLEWQQQLDFFAAVAVVVDFQLILQIP